MQTGKKTYFFILLLVGEVSALLFLCFSSYYIANPKAINQEEQKLFLSSVKHYNAYSPYIKLPAVDLMDSSGKVRSLKSLAGRTLLVNFWAAWCAPCIKEIPALVELQKQMSGKEFDVVFISMDTFVSDDIQSNVITRLKLPEFNTYYAENTKIWDIFAISGLPVTLLISPDAEIMYKFIGDVDWANPIAIRFIQSRIK